MQTEMQTDIITIREVADYLKLTEKTAYRLTAEGEIPGFKVGGSWRFKRSEIEKWIDERSQRTKSKKADNSALDAEREANTREVR